MPKPLKTDVVDTSSSKSKHGTSILPNEKKDANYSRASFDLSANKGLLKRIEKINQTIIQYLEIDKGQPIVLYEAAHHLIRRGGKRIRSLLTLLACEAVNGDIDNALKAALAAELVQTASLINDDIIDDDCYRRGVETVHHKFGIDIAILASNLLVAQAVRLTAEIGLPELLIKMSNGGISMCEGETQDIIMRVENQRTFNEDAYFRMVAKKTVAFMRQAVLIGGLIGDASTSQLQALTAYAEALGYTFQLRDDILDITATSEQAQKTTQSDLRMKRGNLAVIHALNASQEIEKRRSFRALEAGDIIPLLELIEKTNALYYTFDLAKSFNEKAKSVLQGRGFATEKLLEQLADYALYRNY